MAALRALGLALCLLGGATALRTSQRGDPDTDHLHREAVEHAEPGAAGKPTKLHQKEFASLDMDGDRELREAELMRRQYATGCEASEAQIRAFDYMICGDKDSSRTISEAEFEKSMEPEWLQCVMGRSERRAHGFTRFIEADADIDDELSPVELRVAMQKLWGEPGAKLAKPFMKCADADGNGMLSQQEFHDTISIWNPATRKFQGENTKVLSCMDAAMVEFDALLAFGAIDTNGDKKISKAEAYSMITDMHLKMSQEKAEALFTAADLNKDNYLSFEEFKKAGESYKGEGESFFMAPPTPPAPQALGEANTTGMAAACGAQKLEKQSFFADTQANATKALPAKALVAKKASTNTSGLTSMSLGPFDDKVAACKYCFTSHTKSSVVPLCTCTAFDGSDGPTMFCTATPSGIKYAASQDGGCKCNAKNMQQMGAVTCDPF